MRLSDLTKRYRVTLEDPQDANLSDRHSREQIKGRHGCLYLWDEATLALETEKALYQNRLAKHEALIKRYSWCVFLFKINELNALCRLIKALRRREISEKERQRLSEMSQKFGYRHRTEAV